MADVETKKVEEETTTTIKEVSKEVAASEPVVTSDEKSEVPVVEPSAPAAKEAENGTAAAEEGVNGGANGNGTSENGVESVETTEEADGNKIEEVRKRKSEGVEVDATDGVSAEKKAKLDEKTEVAAEGSIESPTNGEAEVTA